MLTYEDTELSVRYRRPWLIFGSLDIGLSEDRMIAGDELIALRSKMSITRSHIQLYVLTAVLCSTVLACACQNSGKNDLAKKDKEISEKPGYQPLQIGELHGLHKPFHGPDRPNILTGCAYKVDLPFYDWGAWSGAIGSDPACINWEATQLGQAESQFGKNSPVTGLYLNHLGLLYRSYGENRQAQAAFTRAIAIEKNDSSTDANKMMDQLKEVGDSDWPTNGSPHGQEVLRQTLEKTARLKGYHQNLATVK